MVAKSKFYFSTQFLRGFCSVFVNQVLKLPSLQTGIVS